MRAGLVDLLCCPACREHGLELRTLEEQPCEAIAGVEGPEVVSGWLRCSGCARLYFVVEGIPRLLTESFAGMLDLSLPGRFLDEFAEVGEELETLRGRIAAAARERDERAEWNIDDTRFWDGEVYGDEEEVRGYLQRAAIGRPDAGNRNYPRERFLMSNLRPRLAGGSLLDLGCGLSQTVRVLLDPDEVGFLYVGAELAINALRINRRTMRGEFVQCSADQLPFRPASVDALLMLGTLHHLADHDSALETALVVVKPGGAIALDEVVHRSGLAAKIPVLRNRQAEESEHNEFVDPELIRRHLASAGEIEVMRREYSPVRGLLAQRLAEPMRTRPWLTRLVIALDRACIVTLGRFSPIFAGNELLAFARKSRTAG